MDDSSATLEQFGDYCSQLLKSPSKSLPLLDTKREMSENFERKVVLYNDLPLLKRYSPRHWWVRLNVLVSLSDGHLIERELATKEITAVLQLENMKFGLIKRSKRGVHRFSIEGLSGKDVLRRVYEVRTSAELSALYEKLSHVKSSLSFLSYAKDHGAIEHDPASTVDNNNPAGTVDNNKLFWLEFRDLLKLTKANNIYDAIY